MKATVIERKYEGETAVLIATGPSINEDQIGIVQQAHQEGKCRIITVNNAYQIAPWTNAHLSCNDNWWKHYWPKDEVLREMPADKYTRYPDLAKKYGILYIHTIVKDGLSTNPSVLHINHGSGPLAMNLASLYGINRLLLIGHDMKFSKNYDGRKKKVGSNKRHFFGEYPKELQHWPSVKVGLSKPGTLDGLIEAYKKMVPQLQSIGMKVINCTPNSDLKCFPMSTLEKEL